MDERENGSGGVRCEAVLDEGFGENGFECSFAASMFALQRKWSLGLLARRW